MDCPDCGGTGTTRIDKEINRGERLGGVRATCFRCDGTGEICDICGESTAVCKGDCRDDEWE